MASPVTSTHNLAANDQQVPAVTKSAASKAKNAKGAKEKGGKGEKEKGAKGAGSRRRLESTHKLIILDWLTERANYEACFGASAKTAPGKAVPKREGFRRMAANLFKVSKFKLEGKAMQERWNTYRKAYTEAKRLQGPGASGQGITPADRKKGITTIKQKLESICTHFDKCDSTFGNRASVKPVAPVDTCVSSDGEGGDEPADAESEEDEEGEDGNDTDTSGKSVELLEILEIGRSDDDESIDLTKDTSARVGLTVERGDAVRPVAPVADAPSLVAVADLPSLVDSMPKPFAARRKRSASADDHPAQDKTPGKKKSE